MTTKRGDDGSRCSRNALRELAASAAPVDDHAGEEQHGEARNPRTAARRARTRAKLLTAARTVFERDGFHTARLSDIVQSAAVSIGTFYNYYTSKEEIFRDVMGEVTDDLVRAARGDGAWSTDAVRGIEQANRSYVRGYRRNAKLMSLLMQAAEQDDEMRALRLEIRDLFEKRLTSAIVRWQAEGKAWPDLDPRYAANALAYMVDRFLYEWVMLDLDYDEETVVKTLTRLWARALGLERPTDATDPTARVSHGAEPSGPPAP